jgi:outer membrane protein OmpA-like peptidoglycan-associated protein
MNLKSILVLIVMLIWWIVCWKHYTCGIKNFCDSDSKTEIDSSKLQIPAFPISFNLNSDSALLHEFEVFRSDICSKYNGQTIEIVGSYFADETNTTSFSNLGLARAQQLKNLLASCMDTSKIRLVAMEISKDSSFVAPFDALKIQMADTTNYSNLSEVKVVSHDNSAEIYFPSSSIKGLSNEGFTTLLKDYIAKIGISSQKIKLEGHTDNVGAEYANKTLSEDRCKVVRDQLVSLGLSKDKIVIEAFGSSKPKVDNNTPENRAKNRRVEIKIIQ